MVHNHLTSAKFSKKPWSWFGKFELYKIRYDFRLKLILPLHEKVLELPIICLFKLIPLLTLLTYWDTNIIAGKNNNESANSIDAIRNLS